LFNYISQTKSCYFFFSYGIYSIAFYKKFIYLEFNLGKVNGKFSMKFYSGRMSGINFYMRNCLFGLWNFRNEEALSKFPSPSTQFHT